MTDQVVETSAYPTAHDALVALADCFKKRGAIPLCRVTITSSYRIWRNGRRSNTMTGYIAYQDRAFWLQSQATTLTRWSLPPNITRIDYARADLRKKYGPVFVAPVQP